MSRSRIRVDNPPPFPELRDGEGTPAAAYKFLRSVQFKETAPYGIVNVHLARHVFDRDPEAFLEHPALSVLAGFPISTSAHAHQTVVIGAADPQTADYLKIALGAPTAQCRCVVIDAAGIADLCGRHHLPQRCHQAAHRSVGESRAASNAAKPGADRQRDPAAAAPRPAQLRIAASAIVILTLGP